MKIKSSIKSALSVAFLGLIGSVPAAAEVLSVPLQVEGRDFIAGDACTTGPIGAVCEDGATFVGEYQGRRLYAMLPEITTTRLINGTPPDRPRNLEDGQANMALMRSIGLSYFPIAEICSQLGEDFFPPAPREMLAIANADGWMGRYVTSSAHPSNNTHFVFVDRRSVVYNNSPTGAGLCVRL